MKDCSICKYCDEDFGFDEETGEEYPVYKCQKGNDTSLDYECKDFKKYKPRKYKEEDTECDICEYREKCAKYSSGIDCTTNMDLKTHIVYPQDKCIKRQKCYTRHFDRQYVAYIEGRNKKSFKSI